MSDYTYKNKKRAHTRDKSERRDKVTSVRCSENEFAKIQKNAKAAGMNVNKYLVTTGANGGNALTPELMVEIQNQINYACSVVALNAPDEVVTMQEGANKLWQKLM